MAHSHHPNTTERPFGKGKIVIALIMLGIIGIFYVAREHYGHLSHALFYLILLLCPLMHLFGHNHGGHSHSPGSNDSNVDKSRRHASTKCL